MSNFVHDKLNKRWDLIVDQIHSAAFLFDPRYCDVAIRQQDFEEGEEFLRKTLGNKWKDLAKQLYIFRAQKGIFKPGEEKLNPIYYWRRLRSTIEYRELADFALRLLSFPQSSAACERRMSSIRQ
eukprot:TRINITY_DN1989_c0_g2_i7.p1 TRINITY_DN1989_c0_g2~~TRINITY_DN1989_c0_g2_i7.p1  ORF type:complete len:125 (-),score=17.82 TRINITY_DN1989_c0_g2_i7:64-438(-)